ncbi:MAG TPA: hypothetical protein VFU51_01795 [Gaiellaceae bacterium]|nr:hypothetical protein [Gaiellaceae bacterium]
MVRTFLGFLVAAIALAAAAYLSVLRHEAHTTYFDTGETASGQPVGTEAEQIASGKRRRSSSGGWAQPSWNLVQTTVKTPIHRKAGWQDAAAVLIAVSGVGAGAGIVRRN